MKNFILIATWSIVAAQICTGEERPRIEISVIQKSHEAVHRSQVPADLPVFAVWAYRFEGRPIPAATDSPNPDVVQLKFVCSDKPYLPISVVRTPGRVSFTTDDPVPQLLGWESLSRQLPKGCYFLEKDRAPFELLIRQQTSFPVSFRCNRVVNGKGAPGCVGQIVTVNHHLYALTDKAGRGVLELPQSGEWRLKVATNPLNSKFKATFNGQSVELAGINLKHNTIPAGRSVLKLVMSSPRQKEAEEDVKTKVSSPE